MQRGSTARGPGTTQRDPNPPFALCLITPELPAEEIIARTARALRRIEPGSVAVQLRAQQLTSHQLLATAVELRRLTRKAGALLFVNDRLDVSLLAEADGVQLPERGLSVDHAKAVLGPNALVGRSCHGLEGLRRAQDAGAHFATLSPVFSSPGKGQPIGSERFAATVGHLRLPVVALGGITSETAGLLARSRAAAVAVIRAVYADPDPDLAARALVDAFRASQDPLG